MRCSLAVVLSIAAVVPARIAHGLDVSAEADYGSPLPLASTDDPPLVRLSFVDLYGLSAEVTAQAAAEGTAVLGRLGARTEVRCKAPSDAHDPRDLLVVVMPGDPGPLLKRTVMGAVQRDAPTRALWVFPRTIAAALGLSAGAAASGTPADRAVFARALGRVVAHEVVHLTCPWREHDPSGLMAARMSRTILRGAALEPEAALRRDFVLGAAAQGRWPLLAQVDGSPWLPPLTRNSGPAQRPPMASRGQAGYLRLVTAENRTHQRLVRRLRKG